MSCASAKLFVGSELACVVLVFFGCCTLDVPAAPHPAPARALPPLRPFCSPQGISTVLAACSRLLHCLPLPPPKAGQEGTPDAAHALEQQALMLLLIQVAMRRPLVECGTEAASSHWHPRGPLAIEQASLALQVALLPRVAEVLSCVLHRNPLLLGPEHRAQWLGGTASQLPSQAAAALALEWAATLAGVVSMLWDVSSWLQAPAAMAAARRLSPGTPAVVEAAAAAGAAGAWPPSDAAGVAAAAAAALRLTGMWHSIHPTLHPGEDKFEACLAIRYQQRVPAAAHALAQLAARLAGRLEGPQLQQALDPLLEAATTSCKLVQLAATSSRHWLLLGSHEALLLACRTRGAAAPPPLPPYRPLALVLSAARTAADSACWNSCQLRGRPLCAGMQTAGAAEFGALPCSARA